jgi:hypothetical protein
MKNFVTKYFFIAALMVGTIVADADILPAPQMTNILEQFVFVGFYAAGAGPLPVGPVNRFLLIPADGRGQKYEVANFGDQLVSLEEKRVIATKLFDYLSTNITHLPSSPFHHPNYDGMVYEGADPSVEVSIKMSQDKTYRWEGRERELSKELKELVNFIENNLQTGQAVSVEKANTYLVAHWLNQIAVDEFRREGMMHAVGSGTNTASAVVLESLQHPFRLIPVKQDTNPFAPYCRNFRPGFQTLEVNYLGKYFQIRSIAVTTNSTIGVKNENK